MERARRVGQFWSWLPAFRAVAETEHLPSAARALGVSPPALSRMVRLLEDELGHALFDRHGRKLTLNEAGAALLLRVRDAMRQVDDGVDELAAATFRGAVRVSASNSVSLAFVLPAVALLARRYPELEPEIVSVAEDEAASALRTARVDVALVEHTELADDVDVEKLGDTTYGVYCGSGHALWRRRRLTLDECVEHGFVGPAQGGADGWPLNLRRQLALRVSALNLAIEVCASGRLLALLPDDVARGDGRLRRLSVGTLATQPVFVAFRRPQGLGGRAAAVVDALREVARARAVP